MSCSHWSFLSAQQTLCTIQSLWQKLKEFYWLRILCASVQMEIFCFFLSLSCTQKVFKIKIYLTFSLIRLYVTCMGYCHVISKLCSCGFPVMLDWRETLHRTPLLKLFFLCQCLTCLFLIRITNHSYGLIYMLEQWQQSLNSETQNMQLNQW